VNKPQITVLGTDNLYDIANKAREAMKAVCSEGEASKAINQLFEAEPLSKCLKGIEMFLDVTYKFGWSSDGELTYNRA
jgi:hypothetical protein